MPEFRYDSVRLVIGEPNVQVRQGIKSALYSKGFREIVDVGAYLRLYDAVDTGPCDLLVVDMDLPGGDVCDLIHQVRHHRIGPNPFLLTIALCSEPSVASVKRVIDSGSDDLIIKPVAVEVLVERIDNLARGRKPFVVTHDYIGPDRRKGPRPEEVNSAAIMEVPNPLRAKALGSYDQHSLQRLIDAAASRINDQKMERYAVQIAYLVEQLTFAWESQATEDVLEPLLDRMAYVAEDLSRRLRGTAYAHVSELAMSLMGLTARMLENPLEPDHVDLSLLPKLSQAINRAFSSADAKTAEAASQISELTSHRSK